MLAKAAYIEAVDQNVVKLPLGRGFNPNTTGLIVLPAGAYYSEITNPNLTTIADDDPWTIAGIDGRRLLRV